MEATRSSLIFKKTFLMHGQACAPILLFRVLNKYTYKNSPDMGELVLQKCAICKNWSPFKFILQTIGGQHITGTDASCSLHPCLQLLLACELSQVCSQPVQWRSLVYTAIPGSLDCWEKGFQAQGQLVNMLTSLETDVFDIVPKLFFIYIVLIIVLK